MIAIRPAEPSDTEALCELRCALWPEGSAGEHSAELDAYFAGTSRQPLQVLVAVGEGGRLLGFCEVGIRPHAEGCLTDRVGYLEGWYVVPDGRRQGVGRALVQAAEEWARGQGCTELASDTAADNRVGVTAHEALGFAEVGLVRCFRKVLSD